MSNVISDVLNRAELNSIIFRSVHLIIVIAFIFIVLGGVVFSFYESPIQLTVDSSDISKVGWLWERLLMNLEILQARGETFESFIFVHLVNLSVPFLAGISNLSYPLYLVFSPVFSLSISFIFFFLWWSKLWMLCVAYAAFGIVLKRVIPGQSSVLNEMIGDSSYYYSGLKLKFREGTHISRFTLNKQTILKSELVEQFEILSKISARNNTNMALLSLLAEHRDYPLNIDGEVGDNVDGAMSEISALYQTTVFGKESVFSPIIDDVRARFIRQNFKHCVTTILAARCGIVCSFKKIQVDGQPRFQKVQIMPCIIARGIVNNLPSFINDYPVRDRNKIRMGLVYGQKYSTNERIYPENLDFEGLVYRDIANVVFVSNNEEMLTRQHEWLEDRLALHVRNELVTAFRTPNPFVIENCFAFEDGFLVPVEVIIGIVKKSFDSNFFLILFAVKEKLKLKNEIFTAEDAVKLYNRYKLNQEDCFIWLAVMTVLVKRNYLATYFAGIDIAEPYIFNASVRAASIVGVEERSYSLMRNVFLRLNAADREHTLEASQIEII